MAASAYVLQTYEVVELTLLHLPLIEILLAQRVCKTWHLISNRSQRIQQALFFPTSSDVKIKQKTDTIRRDGWDWINKDGWDWITEAGATTVPPPVLNPLLHPLVRVDDDENVKFIHYGLVIPTDSNGKMTKIGTRTLAVHKAEASWRHMLVVQPPATNLGFYRTQATCREAILRDVFWVEDKEGICMGSAIDALRKHWYICTQCPVGWMLKERRPTGKCEV